MFAERKITMNRVKTVGRDGERTGLLLPLYSTDNTDNTGTHHKQSHGGNPHGKVGDQLWLLQQTFPFIWRPLSRLRPSSWRKRPSHPAPCPSHIHFYTHHCIILFRFYMIFNEILFYKVIMKNMLRIQNYMSSFQITLRGPNLKTVAQKYVIVANIRLVPTKQDKIFETAVSILVDCLLILSTCWPKTGQYVYHLLVPPNSERHSAT